MMSSLPSLSQSISPTPPLIDSTMYFLSGEEMCATVRPAFCATSSNCGRDGAFSAGELAGGLAGAACAGNLAVRSEPVHRKKIHTETEAGIGRRSIIQCGLDVVIVSDTELEGKTKRPRLSLSLEAYVYQPYPQ